MPDRIIVFEQEPYWAPELRRQFIDHDVVVRHCSDLLSLAEVNPDGTDVMVATVDGNERDCAEVLRRGVCGFRIFIGSPATAELEAPFREAGASSFLVEQPGGEELARRIERIWSPVG